MDTADTRDAPASPQAPAGPSGAGRLLGTVAPGLGQGGGFVALPWVRDGLAAALGAAPYPGTLNLAVDAEAFAALRREAPALPFPPGEPGFCAAVLYRVRAGGRPALVVWPSVEDYPRGKLELVLADRLPVGTGDRLAVTWNEPAPARASAADPA